MIEACQISWRGCKQDCKRDGLFNVDSMRKFLTQDLSGGVTKDGAYMDLNV